MALWQPLWIFRWGICLKTVGEGATIEMKIQYLRPIREGKVTCEGRFIKKGRTLSFMESRLSDQDGQLAAVATATWKMPG